EVEPIDYEDTDTEKRLRFYKRINFTHASSIEYNRKSLATNKKTMLTILYWSPKKESEYMNNIQLIKMYESIHTYKDKKLYRKYYQAVEELLSFDEGCGRKDMLSHI